MENMSHPIKNVMVSSEQCSFQKEKEKEKEKCY